MTLTRDDALVSWVAVKRLKKGRFELVATFRLAEALTLAERMRLGWSAIQRMFKLRPAANALTRLTLPTQVKTGRYTLRLTLTDSYRRSTTSSVRVRVP